jgi:hypothetical protein
MTKAKTFFPQVPVEFAKKVAEAESKGHTTEPVERPKKSPNGNGPADHKAGGDEDV